MDSPEVLKSLKVIEVKCKYSFRDYYFVIRDYLPRVLLEDKRKRVFGMEYLTRKTAPFIAASLALLKGKLKPIYDFSITSEGIERLAGTKKFLVSWNEIKRVNLYSTAFFVELQNGSAMPLPYRFFSDEQKRILSQAFQKVS